MANSKLLKEAIADAKAVRETAIANAKIALEEAFTPRLQSMLSRKLQAEMEEEDEDLEDVEGGEEELTGEEEFEAPVEDEEVPAEDEEVTEEEEFEAPAEDEEAPVEDEEVPADEDELDLEAIIRELEGETEEEENGEECEDCGTEEPIEEEDEELDLDIEDDETAPEEVEDDTIDLDEILREMGYGDDEEETPAEEPEDSTDELEAELDEAYKTIKSLKKTINEVNLLNAKLLYSNKLFRSYNLTNEQKVKVVENLDRTSTVREVKLVYATLAESMKFTGTEKKIKRNISEGFASKPVASTAPKKEIISESSDALANRFKQLAGIKTK